MNFAAPDRATVMVIVSIIAIVIFFGISVFIYKQFQCRFNSNDYAMCSDEDFDQVHLEPNYLIKLHYLLHISDKILKMAKVEYVAISGTLLSMFRTEFLTPWDDDGDLNVNKADFEQSKSKIDQLLQHFGLYLNDPFWFAKLEIFQLKMVDGHPLQAKYPSAREPFVDWVLYEKMTTEDAHGYENSNGRDVYHFSSPRERELFPREFLFSDELYPIRQKSLAVFSAAAAKRLGVENPTLSLDVPNNAISFLNRAYGAKNDKSMWRDCYLASSHQSMTLFVKPCKLTENQVQRLLND